MKLLEVCSCPVLVSTFQNRLSGSNSIVLVGCPRTLLSTLHNPFQLDSDTCICIVMLLHGIKLLEIASQLSEGVNLTLKEPFQTWFHPRPESSHYSPEKDHPRSETEMVCYRPEKIHLKLERACSRPERACSRPERAHPRPERSHPSPQI